MIGDGVAQNDFSIVTDCESTVVLSQTFIEPRRCIFQRVIDQQVGVLVEDDGVRILLASDFGGQRYVIHIRTGLEIACCGRVGFEGTIRAIAFENDNGRRHRATEIDVSEQQGEDFAKLFEPGRDLFDLLFAGIADKEEIVRADTGPRVLSGDT